MDAANEQASIEIRTVSPEQTEALAGELGRLCPAATVFALRGGLGAGKTCFVRGLAAGLGIDAAEVCSPSFVYLVEYGGGRFPLAHADLYRLTGLEEASSRRAFESIGLEEALAGEGVTVVEWWEAYVGPEPQQLVSVEFSIDSVEDRTLRFTLRGAALQECRQALTRYARKGSDGATPA